MERLEDRLALAVVNWTGAGDGVNWSDPRNWSTNQLPHFGDDVIINVSPDTTVLHGSGSDSIHSLQSQNALSVAGGSLTIADTSVINNTLGITGGTLTANGNLDLQSLIQRNGELSGPGTLTIEVQWDWTGGKMSGIGHTVFPSTATANLSGGFFSMLSDRTVDSSGTAIVPVDDGFDFSGNAVWNNLRDSTFILPGNGSLGNFFTRSASGFNNSGLLQKAGTTGVSSIDIPLNNTGLVDIEEGTLSLAAGSTLGGAISLSANTTLNFADGSGNATIKMAEGSRLNSRGTYIQQSGSSLSMAAGSLLNVAGNYTVQAGSTVAGDGTVEVGSFNNFNVGDDITLKELILRGGTVTVTGNIALQNLTHENGTLTGTGTVTIAGQWTWTSGNMSGIGHTVLPASATATLSGGFFSMLIDRTVDNSGSVEVPFNDGFDFNGNAVWNNLAGSTFVMDGNSTLGNFFAGPGAVFNNAGLLRKIGNGPSTIAINVVNSGQVNPGGTEASGPLVINGNYTQTADGILNIEIGGVTPGRDYSQLMISGVATLDGTLNIRLINDFSPDVGNNFKILTFASRVGDFATESGLDLDDGHHLDPRYDRNSLTLVTV